MTSKKSTRSIRSASPASSRAPRAKKATPARRPRAAKPGAQAATVAARETPATTVVRAARIVTDEEIRVRAYFLSLEYNGDGSDVDFWLLAERELRPRTNTSE